MVACSYMYLLLIYLYNKNQQKPTNIPVIFRRDIDKKILQNKENILIGLYCEYVDKEVLKKFLEAYEDLKLIESYNFPNEVTFMSCVEILIE